MRWPSPPGRQHKHAGGDARRSPGRAANPPGHAVLGATSDVAHRRGMAGMTLIEVLVALAIVATALATGIKAAAALASNSERLGDTLAAQWCAENQLGALRLAQQFPAVGDSDFSCEQLGHSYAGHLIVRTTPNPNFRRVDAQIDDERGYPLLRLSTVVSRF